MYMGLKYLAPELAISHLAMLYALGKSSLYSLLNFSKIKDTIQKYILITHLVELQDNKTSTYF